MIGIDKIRNTSFSLFQQPRHCLEFELSFSYGHNDLPRLSTTCFGNQNVNEDVKVFLVASTSVWLVVAP